MIVSIPLQKSSCVPWRGSGGNPALLVGVIDHSDDMPPSGNDSATRSRGTDQYFAQAINCDQRRPGSPGRLFAKESLYIRVPVPAQLLIATL